MAGKLVLCRHGQSDWNLKNLFTGWTDVDLTEKGIQEGIDAGRLLTELGYEFDIAYTSVLKRAIRTLWHMLDQMDLMWIPVVRDWRLNERHYGALQGLNKAETGERHGKEQLHIWRRSYDIPPPPLDSLPGGEGIEGRGSRSFHPPLGEDRACAAGARRGRGSGVPPRPVLQYVRPLPLRQDAAGCRVIVDGSPIRKRVVS